MQHASQCHAVLRREPCQTIKLLLQFCACKTAAWPCCKQLWLRPLGSPCAGLAGYEVLLECTMRCYLAGNCLTAVTLMRHTREILEGTLLTVAPPTANSTWVRLCCAARYSSHTALHSHQQQCTPYCPCTTQVQQAMQSWQPQVHMSYVACARPLILRRTWAVAEAACGSEGAGMGHEQLAHSGSLLRCKVSSMACMHTRLHSIRT